MEIADRPKPTRRRPDGRRPAHVRTYGILAVSLIGVLVVAGLGLAGGSRPARRPVVAPRVTMPVVRAVGHRALVRRAVAAERVLMRDFANTRPGDGWPGLFRTTGPTASTAGRRLYYYWWQAQALDLLVDRQLRAPTPAGRRRIAALIAGVQVANGGTLHRRFYDDMGWMALAVLRADSVGVPTIGLVRGLWQAILTGYNHAQGGGIAWHTSRPAYKDVASSGPAAILAAWLYARDHRPADLAMARDLVAFMQQRFVDARTGRVADGVNRHGRGEVDREDFSYDVGLMVGADLALAQVTGDAALRAHALWVARANLPIIAPNGILRDEGPGGPALFRGIAARYLAQLHDPRVDAVLRASADAAWSTRNRAGRFGDSWIHPAPAGTTQLSAQVGATMLLEQLAR